MLLSFTSGLGLILDIEMGIYEKGIWRYNLG
jgi:hypothetical protein